MRHLSANKFELLALYFGAQTMYTMGKNLVLYPSMFLEPSGVSSLSKNHVSVREVLWKQSVEYLHLGQYEIG